MLKFDYTCIFDPIGEKLKKGQMRIIDHATNQTHNDLLVAVDDGQLSLINYKAIPPLLADLIDIATAIHMADRLSKSNGNMPRRILLRLPLRNEKYSIDLLYVKNYKMFSIGLLKITGFSIFYHIMNMDDHHR